MWRSLVESNLSACQVAKGAADLAAHPGIDGDGAHTADDHADLDTLTPRAYLLARVLMDVGHDPKGR